MEDECFYVLDGEGSIRCGSDTFSAPAGSFAFLPRGLPHRFQAKQAKDQAKPARLLLITVPGGIEDYFHQINNASDDKQRHQIGEQYGIRVVPGICQPEQPAAPCASPSRDPARKPATARPQTQLDRPTVMIDLLSGIDA